MISGRRLRYRPYLHADYLEVDLGEADSVRLGAFEDDAQGMYVEPSYVSFGDYGGSMVERSNYEEFLEQFAESRGAEWWTWGGDYGSHGLIVRVDADERVPEIGEFFRDLDRSLCASDNRLEELEMEATNEAWTDYGAADFVRALLPIFPSLDDRNEDEVREALTPVYYALSDLYGQNSNVEDAAGSVAFHIDVIIERLTAFVEDLNIAGEAGSAAEREASEDGYFGPATFEAMMNPALYGSDPNTGMFEYGGWIYKLLHGHYSLRFHSGARAIFQDVLRERGLEAGLQFLEKMK